MFVILKTKPMPCTDYSITEHIPVADHVYKYLLKKCGSDHYTASRNDIIGNIIINSLGKHNDLSINKSEFTKQFNVTIKEKQLLKNGFFIGVKVGQVFNGMVDKLFREELYSHLGICKEQGYEQFMQSLRNFLDVYQITEDDIKMESLYRDFKRKKDVYFHT